MADDAEVICAPSADHDLGQIYEHLRLRNPDAAGEVLEDVEYRDSGAPNAGLPASDLRVDGNAFEQIHAFNVAYRRAEATIGPKRQRARGKTGGRTLIVAKVLPQVRMMVRPIPGAEQSSDP